MSEKTTTARTTLENHPRMIGALFTLVLLLSQAGSVMANNSVTIDCYSCTGF
jgi:hypothetical protein